MYSSETSTSVQMRPASSGRNVAVLHKEREENEKKLGEAMVEDDFPRKAQVIEFSDPVMVTNHSSALRIAHTAKASANPAPSSCRSS